MLNTLDVNNTDDSLFFHRRARMFKYVLTGRFPVKYTRTHNSKIACIVSKLAGYRLILRQLCWQDLMCLYWRRLRASSLARVFNNPFSFYTASYFVKRYACISWSAPGRYLSAGIQAGCGERSFSHLRCWHEEERSIAKKFLYCGSFVFSQSRTINFSPPTERDTPWASREVFYGKWTDCRPPETVDAKQLSNP